MPGRTAVDIAPETIAWLRKGHDNIVGSRRPRRTSSTSPGYCTSRRPTPSSGPG
ncbi:MAG TPA: hypothetical protein VMA73_00105 [Streptosporangiaceae bacterium]|nr:hypothetical protein [Streptosporangiaceae bacterium]